MVALGACTTDPELPYLESMVGGSISWLLPNNTQQNLTLTTFTLPWMGRISAVLHLNVTWSGNQQFTSSLINSSPVPNNYGSETLQVYNSTVFAMSSCFGHWTNVTSATIGVRCTIANGNPDVTAVWYTLLMRGFRT